jgi:hypothetical protein
MYQRQVKTHGDGIWISDARETEIVKTLQAHICQAGWVPLAVDSNLHFGLPWQYRRGNLNLHCRVVDSVYHPSTAAMSDPDTIFVTDSHALHTVVGSVLSVLPEFWSIWHFEPVYIDRVPVKTYNCFMNRCRGDRSQVFYELCKRNILHEGFVSYNCSHQALKDQYQAAEMQSNYRDQHQRALELIPYNTVESHGTLEQCIIDSNVSLILETYISDSHIVFSEKIFRALQLPRPWLLYCSSGSVALLKRYGFDVLDDYADVSYDNIVVHGDRLQKILDQLETFIHRKYTEQDYQRFAQAAAHNQTLLAKFAQQWPTKFNEILNRIKEP